MKDEERNKAYRVRDSRGGASRLKRRSRFLRNPRIARPVRLKSKAVKSYGGRPFKDSGIGTNVCSKTQSIGIKNLVTQFDYDTPGANPVKTGWSKQSYDIMSGKVFEAVKYSDNDGEDKHRVITRNEYDKLGRIIRKTYKNTDSNYDGNNVYQLLNENIYIDEENAVVSKSYIGDLDNSFRQTKAVNDWLGRGVLEEYSWPGLNGAGESQVVRNSYNYSGDLIQKEMNSGELNIDNQYHSATPDEDHCNKTAILDGSTPKIIEQTDYLGLLKTLKYGTTTAREVSYTYNNFLQVNSLTSSEATPELDISLTRDFNGNVLTKEGNTYAYDGMNRLLSGEGDEYSYDEISNILSDGSNTCEYQSIGEEKNQMRLKTYNDGASDYNYTYDDNGNTESISEKFFGFDYDSFNRLRTVTHADDTVDKYAYNTAGLRIKKEEDVSGSDIIIYTMYSGNNPVIQEKYNGSAIVETRFNIISGGRMLGHIRKVYGTSEDYEYFYLDDLSSRRAVLNSSGSVTDKFTFSAYGKVTHVSGSNAYLASFTGKEYDATGYIYFNARYYDPETGRFLSEDALKDGLNFYSYAANNPLRFVDPSGHRPTENVNSVHASGSTGSNTNTVVTTGTSSNGSSSTKNNGSTTGGIRPTVADRSAVDTTKDVETESSGINEKNTEESNGDYSGIWNENVGSIIAGGEIIPLGADIIVLGGAATLGALEAASVGAAIALGATGAGLIVLGAGVITIGIDLITGDGLDQTMEFIKRITK